MNRYYATYTHTNRDGQTVTGSREFTYPVCLTNPCDMVGVAEHILGLTVSSRDLVITSVRLAGFRLQTEEI
jgi:hypothetical protein